MERGAPPARAVAVVPALRCATSVHVGARRVSPTGTRLRPFGTGRASIATRTPRSLTPSAAQRFGVTPDDQLAGTSCSAPNGQRHALKPGESRLAIGMQW